MLGDRKTISNDAKLYINMNLKSYFKQNSEAVVQRCSVKKVFLEISQNSQENTCARVSFLIKLQDSGLRTATLLKKRLWHRCFPVNFVKFLRTPFLQNTSSGCFSNFTLYFNVLKTEK